MDLSQDFTPRSSPALHGAPLQDAPLNSAPIHATSEHSTSPRCGASARHASPSGISLSQKKAKRQAKGPTLKPQGITKPSSILKKHTMTGAFHRFAADPKRKTVGVGFKAFETLTPFMPYSTNPHPGNVNHEYEFQEIETPATLALAYASGLYNSPEPSTSASPSVMNSASPTNSASSINLPFPMESHLPTSSFATTNSFTPTNLFTPTTSFSPVNSINPTNPFDPTNSINLTTPSGPMNLIKATSSFVSLNPTTPMNSMTPTLSSPPSAVYPSFEHRTSRKRSADDLKGSELKRQKTDPFKPYIPLSTPREGFLAIEPSSNATQISNGHVVGSAAEARVIHSQTQHISNPDNKPLNTPVRSCDIASLLNHQEAEDCHRQNTLEHADTLSANMAGNHDLPISTYHTQAILATPASGGAVSLSTSRPQDPLASSQNGLMPKRKYEVSEEANERSPKRSKLTDTLTKPARKSKVGRPKNPPKPPRVRDSLPTLTSKLPVENFPLDLWNEVFGYSAPGFLLKAQFTSRLFNIALKYDRIWESARITTYPDCPSPPAGMSEKEYAFHLDGIGCQVMTSGRKCPDKCRRTYWAFQKKWCANHLKERLVSAREVQDSEANYPDIHHLLPSAGFDSWNTYLCAGRYTAKPPWLRCLPYKTFYLDTDVDRLKQEYDKIRATQDDGTTRSPAEIQTWVDAKKAEVVSLVQKRQKIEAWVETKRLAEVSEHQNHSQAKKDFYKVRALAMSPPLEFAALEHTRSYQNAIAIKKAPTERSWQILEEKLETERHYAEEIVRLDREAHRQGIPPDDHLGFGPYGIRDDITKQGRLVIDLAQQQIAIANFAYPDTTATDEWVPRILNGFYEAFEALDNHQKLDDNGNVISLTMYHAKLVAQQIEAHFQIARGNPVPQYLTVKCPLCPHKGASTTRSFERHVSHIGKKHARSNPGFAHWRMFDNRAFPWMRVAWPKNLPVLRKSEMSTGQWDLGF